MKLMNLAALGLGTLAAAGTAVHLAPTAPPATDYIIDQEKVVPIEVVTKSWTCPDCNDNEKYVLQKLQEKTKISDPKALAAIMGNIKQESNFHPNICEGGDRIPYSDCRLGGYGLIQWTSVGRYRNLGKFAERYNMDPSSLEGQTSYMINEAQFQDMLPEFEGRGRTISQYMVPCFYWLGWGIKGNREVFAYQYLNKLVYA
tara:strand:+ start:1846 stop:2448 length:603 start_codon:yes stop_codon:yes gene_type:complete